jgi:hypothetical protein
MPANGDLIAVVVAAPVAAVAVAALRSYSLWHALHPGEPMVPRGAGVGWFGPKRLGVGISPRSWQGWLVTLGFAAGMLALPRLAHGASTWMFAGIAVLFALFGVIVALTYKADD